MGTKSIAYHQIVKKHSITCKCPVCQKLHKVPMSGKPDVLPRVYCPQHVYRRYKYSYCA